MNRPALVVASFLLALFMAGCGGQEDGGDGGSTNGGYAASNSTSPSPTPNVTAEPRRIEVFNETLQFSTTGTPTTKPMALSEPGLRIEFHVSIRTRDANVPTFLQPEQGESRAFVLFKPPSGTEGQQDLDPVVQTTPTQGGFELKWYEGGVVNGVAGSWTVEAHGVGNNVDARVIVREVVA